MNVANESSSAPILRRLPFLVRLAPQFLNHLFAVLEESSHPSGEMNGLLFGLIENDFAVIQVFRLFSAQLDRDGESGSPSAGEEAFERLMARWRSEPDLAGLSLLGWFSARESGGLQAKDIVFHQKSFRHRNDVAMIISGEPASGLSLEIYCRCLDGTLFDEGQRCGTVRIANDSPVVSPVEVPMRAKTSQDPQRRAYQFSDAVEEDEAVSGWKDAFASRTKGAFELLKAAKSEDASESEASESDLKEAERDNLDNTRQLTHDLPFGTGRGAAAAAPARIPQHGTEWHVIEDRTEAGRRLDPEEPRIASSRSEGAPATPLGEAAALRLEDERVALGTNNFHAAAVPASSPPSASPNTVRVDSSGTPSVIEGSTSSVQRSHSYVATTRRKMPWVAMAALFAVVAGGTFGLIYLRGAHANGTLPGFLQAVWPSPGLDLKVSGNGEQVQLNWNRKSPAVRNAEEAVLDIRDGPDHRQILLGAGELANGSVLYLPVTDDVVFQLKVHGPRGQNVSETLRVLGSSKPTTLDASQPRSRPEDTPGVTPPSPAATMAEKQPQIDGKKTVNDSRSMPIKPKQDASRKVDLRAANPITSGSRSVPDRQDAQSSASVPPVSSPRGANAEAPAGGGNLAIPAPSNSSVTTQAAENVPPPGAPPAPQTADPSSSNATANSPVPQPHTDGAAKAPELGGQAVPAQDGLSKTVAGQIPAPPPLQSPQTSSQDAQPLLTYRPPRPVKQVLPKISPLPSGVADSAVEVKVVVKLDESGHVIDARLIEGKKKFGSILRNAALSAAKQWVFEPASLHGKSIASEHTIVFQFRH